MSDKNLKVDNTAIEAKEVALTIQNIQEAAMDLDTIINTKVRQKYPTKYIARPSKEEALLRHKGWELLNYDSSTQSFNVVKSYDDATTNKSGSPLCWRDKRIQDHVDKEEKKIRLISNQKAQGENSSTQAKSLEHQLAQLSGGEIKASPLGDRD